MTPAGDLGQFVTDGLVRIHGTIYPKSVSSNCGFYSGDDSPETYSLNGTATRFQAVVGVEDSWPSDYIVGASVVGDGRTLKVFSVSVLKPQSIDISVTGVYRLELNCDWAVDSSGEGGWNVAVAWGDAHISERG
jgi:hypothetical protein